MQSRGSDHELGSVGLAETHIFFIWPHICRYPFIHLGEQEQRDANVLLRKDPKVRAELEFNPILGLNR